ncbi:uncharacterized mitochondrial protein AtMg00810-like [Rutidosis leptorrhynchoides]|uniref:uncharacterized mitochondrial protein AtMg00810-like n=1 Tax=Rutidosis leptorrhynchoides TaxID=125765 RepID=UPI003A98EC82
MPPLPTPPPTQTNQPPPTQTNQPIRSRPAHLRPNPKQTKPYNASSYHTRYPLSEPATFTIANNDLKWHNAMAEEYSALIRNGTWLLVPHPPDANIETFSPVVKSTTIRVILSLAISHKWPLLQLDVQNAFLNGNLHETVYLKQPQGFVDSAKPNHVCLLQKSLYGLKQAPRAWFHRLSQALFSMGFHGSKTDPSLFVYSSGHTLLYMLVYVDDIILTGNSQAAIDDIVQRLVRMFSIKGMGSLSYFLRIEVTRTGDDVILSQRKYIHEILECAGMYDTKPVSSPMTSNESLALGDGPMFADSVKYRQIVGALQYITLSRPDITFAVNKVCQYMHSPTDNQLRFQHSLGTNIHAYTDSAQNSLTSFSDADWAGCPDDRRSTGGYAIYLGSNLVSWSARKQKTVSRSSTESEYKALADIVAELTWLQDLMHEL